MSKPMGRRSRLTPELQATVVDLLKAGNYVETACAYVNINPSTYHRWIERGETNPDSAYGEFARACAQARAHAEVQSVLVVRKAARDGNWQAAMTWLERSFPQRWGRSMRAEVTGPNGGPVSLEVSREDLVERLTVLLAGDQDPLSGPLADEQV